jgi:hypothetical protein
VYESVLPETGEQRERALCLQQTLLQRWFFQPVFDYKRENKYEQLFHERG